MKLDFPTPTFPTKRMRIGDISGGLNSLISLTFFSSPYKMAGGKFICRNYLRIIKDIFRKIYTYIDNHSLIQANSKRKRTRSDSVLWQKPMHQQKGHKGKVTTQTTPRKISITQRLRTDLGRSVGVTTATQLVWLIWFTGPTFLFPAMAV